MYSCANLSQMYSKGDGVEKNSELSEQYKARALEIQKELQSNKTLTFQEGLPAPYHLTMNYSVLGNYCWNLLVCFPLEAADLTPLKTYSVWRNLENQFDPWGLFYDIIAINKY
ncbi:hypothetical protein NQ318_011272 [Aromia moschata]|uniref:Uncharacterized protein n=1 Tax=Aromia moschata TaxID=1265417 RepID=A0AAV8YHU1_9CUCU|nr:hypothetical protein NQ318_011272 [Aromia moschata]